jgi:hypothetical protein
MNRKGIPAGLPSSSMPDEELEYPELKDEYLRSLQGQVDDLRARNERLTRRIAKLEADRERLRSLVPRRRRPDSAVGKTPAPVDRSLAIPGVGTIPDLALPESPVARPDLRVAVVLDRFSKAAFQYEFDAIDVPAVGWEAALAEEPPHVLLVESAYSGSDGSWAGLVARFGEPSPELAELVHWCRRREIPTVFWSKEDPINHDWFTASAKLFDHVFTVDSNMVDRYRSRLGHDRVGVLQFSAQPVIHHPPEDESARSGGVAFAGSYYAAKHPARREQMEMLLDAAAEFGLHIFDRMDRQDDPRFAWPEKYRPYIVGSLTYPQTLEAYRRYRAFINVNTVVDSPTMCARRVYELLASGTRVISGPSQALDGVPVEIATTMQEARAILSESDDGAVDERIGWVRQGNLTGHRVDTILEAVS